MKTLLRPLKLTTAAKRMAEGRGDSGSLLLSAANKQVSKAPRRCHPVVVVVAYCADAGPLASAGAWEEGADG